jgi:uracil-DNA glycosylase family 4
MKELLFEIKKCTVCLAELDNGVNPVVTAHKNSKIAIIGQAPGSRVHQTGIPWDDPSGVRLRKWLNVDETVFYDAEKFAIIPMGFCYPGKGKTGDLPPRKECAPLWHQRLFEEMPNIKLILLIGSYAQQYYLRKQSERTLTATVQNFENYLPTYFPLPHPSPRNNIWLKRNAWFEANLVPTLQEYIHRVLNS